MSGRPAVQIVLNAMERGQLESGARRRKMAPALVIRSQVVPGCACGSDNKSVAAVRAWNAQFCAFRQPFASMQPCIRRTLSLVTMPSTPG